MSLVALTTEQKTGNTDSQSSRKERPAISSSELELLSLLAEKPLLSGAQLAAVRASSAAWTQRLLAHLQGCGLLAYSVPPGQPDVPANRYYYLKDEGIRRLARRERMAAGRYARKHWLSRSRMTMLFNSLEHTSACRQFFIDLSQEAKKHSDAALEVWLDEAAASQRYRWHGEVRLLRPDGYGVYRHGDRELAFFLEWDSGNMGIKRHRRKLRAYHECRAAAQGGSFPAILAVTVRGRLRQMNRAALQVSRYRRDRVLPLLIASVAELEAAGAFGCQWWDVRTQQSVSLERAPGLWLTIS